VVESDQIRSRWTRSGVWLHALPVGQYTYPVDGKAAPQVIDPYQPGALAPVVGHPTSRRNVTAPHG
jgi:hypothetical protein